MARSRVSRAMGSSADSATGSGNIPNQRDKGPGASLRRHNMAPRRAPKRGVRTAYKRHTGKRA